MRGRGGAGAGAGPGRRPPLTGAVCAGEAVVLQQFTVTEGKRKVPVAGARCVKGALHRDARFRLLRDGRVVHEGESAPPRPAAARPPPDARCPQARWRP